MNKHFHKAKKVKNDEFYTRKTDIEREFKFYKTQFRDKVVFLNCDDPEQSQFWNHFNLNFDYYGIKKLIATHYKPSSLFTQTDTPAYKLELNSYNGKPVKTLLEGDGDFRSQECIEILKESDVVVTNPPFSLFREFIDSLITHNKEFLIVSPKGAFVYKNVFKLFQANKIRTGYNLVNCFFNINKKAVTAPAIWLTNLTIDNSRKELIDTNHLWKPYSVKDYSKYDNYDAINVNKVIDIPKDYFEEIGVPITYLLKHNPKQFEIIGAMRGWDKGEPFINGKGLYIRFIIKRRK